MKDSRMHQTPNVPGTSPVTDNPNPGGSQGSVPSGPGTDTGPRVELPDERSFRCGDAGNADCRWEVSGRTEDELRPLIHNHLREAHGQQWEESLRSHIRETDRGRAA
jgi:predicted small metal-binding protein